MPDNTKNQLPKESTTFSDTLFSVFVDGSASLASVQTCRRGLTTPPAGAVDGGSSHHT